jgi:hypothetical protein
MDKSLKKVTVGQQMQQTAGQPPQRNFVIIYGIRFEIF